MGLDHVPFCTSALGSDLLVIGRLWRLGIYPSETGTVLWAFPQHFLLEIAFISG